ncbi:hypothetical protein, partial [Cecembia lonarensis]|uniref:hypothetical protein n=1 Tax=Cecembia lonarensis TaxID=645110 RepID=UPI001EE67F03
MTKCGGRSDILATSHPGLSWQERSIGHFKEQVNSTPLCKIERGCRLSGNVEEVLGADSFVVVLKLL